MMNEKGFQEYDNSDDDTIPRLLNEWEIDDSYDNDSYDDL